MSSYLEWSINNFICVIRIKEMEDTLRNRERKFELLHQQTLDAINRSNELEDRKIKLLEQLVSRLPHTL